MGSAWAIVGKSRMYLSPELRAFDSYWTYMLSNVIVLLSVATATGICPVNQPSFVDSLYVRRLLQCLCTTRSRRAVASLYEVWCMPKNTFLQPVLTLSWN